MKKNIAKKIALKKFRSKMMKTDRNIQMPEAPSSGRPLKYPWLTMEVGESFVLPAPNLASARAHCTGASARYQKKFAVRQMHGGEFRVWRTA